MVIMKQHFISTSIPYVNAFPHLGHALEFVQADVLARHRRLRGGDVFFLTGTDENALKNVQAAREAGVAVPTFVAERAEAFKRLAAKLSIANDEFIRTTEKRHFDGAQKLWQSLDPKDVYKKAYSGIYCVGCEEFKLERDLISGFCPEHPGKKLELVEEENYFFRLSRYADTLRELITSGKLAVIPESRKNEALAFIDQGLEDFSISRSKERAHGWGVPVPGDESQIMFVWVDALSNYLNALGYASDDARFTKYWKEAEDITHVIGKGINRFHTLYWPALLLSANIRLPDTVFVHGYITVGGQKMSKTIGNVIDPFALIEKYGTDALRYFFARDLPTFEDGDFTEEKFIASYNANLANGLGNLVARVMKLAETHLEAPVVLGKELLDEAERGEYETHMKQFQIQKAADVIWGRLRELDEYVTRERPFEKVATDIDGAKKDITHLVQALAGIAHMLTPFLPETAEKIKTAIKENKKPETLFQRI
ncbi:MAG: methionine--tRNA ligase [Parcubacteria group bacterium]|nr:methionine--tRNA ligase [Parcubacteria group bacterium]